MARTATDRRKNRVRLARWLKACRALIAFQATFLPLYSAPEERKVHRLSASTKPASGSDVLEFKGNKYKFGRKP